MRIAIIGQAAFGAAVYQRLRDDGHTIVGVFTPPEGERPDPLAEAARGHSVALHQPRRWQRKGVPEEPALHAYAATDPALNVMAFVTQIIPPQVLDHPPHGTIQYHPSLLPKHRGRSAINHALINGDAETGLTIFWVDSGIDTGPILLQKRIPIGEDDTLSSLYRQHLFPLGVEALGEAVRLIAAGQAPRLPQNEAEASYEPPWEGDLARIDWSRPAQQIHNLIRGSDRQPGAWTVLNDVTLRLYGSRRTAADSGPPGSVAAVTADGITIRCGDGAAIRLESVRPEGAKPLASADWAAAARIEPGARCQ